MAKKKDVAAYDVPMLVVTPDKLPEVGGNYEAIEKVLKQWKANVLKMDLTADNLEEVTVVKKAAVAVRNNLDRVITAAKKALFNDPKAIFEARAKTLYSLVADVEGKADEVLKELEAQRVAEVNQVLDNYKEKFQEQYQLTDAYLPLINYPKDFYNKTVPKGYSSMDKYWKESLEAQFKELKKSFDAYTANVRLIQATCKDEARLNVKHWIDQLAVADVASILESISSEKERLRELDKPQATTTTTTASEAVAVEAEVVDATAEAKKMILGIPATLNFNTDFPGRTKKMQLEIVYPCDLGDALSELFKQLKTYGIKCRALKEEVPF